MRHNKKLMLTLLALVTIASAAIAATFANFTATPIVVPTNAVATGTLTLSADSSSAIYTLANAKIGASTTGAIAVTNTGSINGTLSMSGVTTGAAALAAQATLKVYIGTDASGTKVYDGSLTGPITVSPNQAIASGATVHYFFVVAVPSAGTDTLDNLIQGESITSTFTWNATQA